MAGITKSTIKSSMRLKWVGILSILLANAFVAAPTLAQTDAERIKELELKLERSLHMLDDLSARIKKMEAENIAAPAAPADTHSRLQSVEQQVSQMVTARASQAGGGHEAYGVPLHGFADVGFSANTQGTPVSNPKGFNVGSLVLFVTPKFGDNVKTLFELAFGVHANGVVEEHLERLQVGYTYSDAATVWAGRFHTPYGYWNTAYHHGAQIQTSIMRPRFLDFEDHEDHSGSLPAHTVGLWATGKIKAGAGRLTYDAFAGNGPKIDVTNPGLATQGPGLLNPNTGGDKNYSLMSGFNVGYEFPGSFDGLKVAGHWFGGDVDDDAVNAAGRFNRTGVNMLGGSVTYMSHTLEVLSEYYHFNNKDKSGATGTHNSWAGYLQAGRIFTNVTPVFRLEKAVFSQQDNYFSMQLNGQSYTRQALGLKYDVNQKASLKFELFHTNFDAEAGRTGSSYNSLLGQFAVRF